MYEQELLLKVQKLVRDVETLATHAEQYVNAKDMDDATKNMQSIRNYVAQIKLTLRVIRRPEFAQNIAHLIHFLEELVTVVNDMVKSPNSIDFCRRRLSVIHQGIEATLQTQNTLLRAA